MRIHIVKLGSQSSRNTAPGKWNYGAWIETPEGKSPMVEGFTKNKALYDLLEIYGDKYGCPIRVVN